MNRFIEWVFVYAFSSLMLPFAAAQETPRVEPDGTIHVPAFDLPESAFLSEESRAALKRARNIDPVEKAAFEACGSVDKAELSELPTVRKCIANVYYSTAFYKRMTPFTANTLRTASASVTSGRVEHHGF